MPNAASGCVAKINVLRLNIVSGMLRLGHTSSVQRGLGVGQTSWRNGESKQRLSLSMHELSLSMHQPMFSLSILILDK